LFSTVAFITVAPAQRWKVAITLLISAVPVAAAENGDTLKLLRAAQRSPAGLAPSSWNTQLGESRC
jgi:dihydroxyacetone kinase